MSKPSSALDASSCDVYADSARHPLTRTWCVAALALICCALWGSAIPCIKIGYELLGIQNGDVPSEFLFAGVRFMLAGAIALAAAVITRRRLPRVSRTGWPLVIRLSLAQTIVQYAFFYIGVSNASGVRGSIVNAMRVDGSARVPARTAHCAQSPRLRYRFCRSRYRQPHRWR